MSFNAQRFAWEELRSMAFGDILATYEPIGTPFDNSARIIKIDNTTDSLLIFSDDGVTDKFVIASSTGLILDISSNREGPNNHLEYPRNTQLYVKQSAIAPTEGDLFLSVGYGALR